MKKIRVGVIFGGRSGEHEVSLRSAESILKALDRNKYEVVPIGITHEGRWLASTKAVAMLPAKDQIQRVLTDGEPITLPAEPASQAIVDVIFPILHGTYGEDGTMQGFLELANVPYVGAGVLGSAIGMDKDVMKRLLRDAGIPVVRFMVATRYSSKKIDFDEARGQLGLPLFVKPANIGSSVGIHKVRDRDEFERAVRDAFNYDNKILIEECIDGREMECSVLGNDNPIASVPGEILPRHEFYSYEAKYLDENGAVLEIPAKVPLEISERIRQTAIKAFSVLC